MSTLTSTTIRSSTIQSSGGTNDIWKEEINKVKEQYPKPE